MEIYKVASQSMQTQASQTIQQDMGTNTPRAIEQTKINANAAEQNSNTANAQNQTNQKQQLDEAINELNNNMEKLQTNLRFGYYDALNTMTVSVVNTKNGDIIRQYPSEQVLNMREKFAEAIGLLFDQKG